MNVSNDQKHTFEDEVLVIYTDEKYFITCIGENVYGK